jgi:fucose permease
LTLVSSLFFLWGFADGLIDTLNTQTQSLLGYSDSQRIALQGAYWAAYFIGPVFVGYWILTRVGFKSMFITGLGLFAVGAMSFWPSSVLRSYPGFIISNVIIALGLSCLENAGNPFIALAGPGEWSESRLNFAQGVQGIGVITSVIIAQQALIAGIGQEDLFRLQWCYLAVAFFVVFLAVVFYYVPLSEASNDDLEELARRRLFRAGLDKRAKTWGWPARHLVLWSGIFAITCYYGAQESIYYFWVPLVNDLKPGSDPFWILVIGRGVFTFSRFLGALLMFRGVPPRIVSLVYAVGAFVTAILTMLLSPGAAALSMLLLTIFFEAPLFPTIFAMGLRNQGRHTKFAATAFTVSICGAGWWPSIVWAVDKSHPRDSRYALRITITLFGVLMFWPLLLSSTRVLRGWVDPRWSKPGLSGEGEHGAPDPLSHRVWTRRGAVN